ncbi:MAG: phage tail protein [Winogradskyella sp.]|nr:MAG: phage tail protein [Winogradskyella sp.]
MDRRLSKEDNNFLGSGWAFPVVFSAGNCQLNLTQYEQNINECINIIMRTNFGERVMEPDFGSGMQAFVFEVMDETLKGEIIDTVKVTLLDNEPRISVENVDVEYESLQNGLVSVFIEYIYNKTNTRHNYVFPFHLKEATNL